MTEDKNKVGYQFTPMPKRLTHLLDVNLRSMMFALVDASEYFADEEDGWFYRTNDQLQLDSCLSKNLVVATIDTLFKLSLVEVSCIGTGKGKKPNNYKVNTDLFKFFEQLDMNKDINRPENQIKTLKYMGSGYHASYLDDDPERFFPELVKGKINWKSTRSTKVSTPDDTNTSTKEPTTDVTKIEHNIDNINNVYNIDNKDNINNLKIKDNVKNIEYINNNNDTNNNINIDFNNNILEEKLEKDKDKEELEREMGEGVTESMTKNEEETQEYPNDTSNNNIPTVRDYNDDIGDSERKSKDEIEAEETPCEYQSLNQSEANQDSAHDDFQNESGGESIPSQSQSNGEYTVQKQEGDTSPSSESHLEEAATGIQMVGLFDPEPSKENQGTRQLSVRAATRKWAEELEAKYQTRERTLQNLAMEDPMGFEKYVNYLRLQRRQAFQQHLELIHDLASFWDIDLDLDLD